MKRNSVRTLYAVTFGVILTGACANGAFALDAPHALRHGSKLTEPHFSESHHTARHAASSHAPAKSTAKSAAAPAHPAARSTAKGSTTAKSTDKAGTRLPAKSGKQAAATLPRGKAALRQASLSRRHRVVSERFTGNSFASTDLFQDDIALGEDPIIRQAAIDALGNMNGTAVVINPSTGRILAMVNQKLALSPGAEPCSTIKITVAMAALSEGIVTRDTMVPLDHGSFRMNMTDALAKSNNLYFEELGRELGFERVHHYAKMFGLGELAGYHLEGEKLGTYPDEELPAAQGGVGRMCSFGQGISLTPLQLGAYVAALANGGTLYYLQHPTSPDEITDFQPRVKRTLDIARYIPEMVDGMAGSVEYGTGRSLRASFREFPVFGKTGTCSDKGTRFGWFASFSETPQGNLVTVFFLEGGRPTFGPKAAELTGVFYKNLWERNYFQTGGQQPVTASLEHSTPGQEHP